METLGFVTRASILLFGRLLQLECHAMHPVSSPPSSFLRMRRRATQALAAVAAWLAVSTSGDYVRAQTESASVRAYLQWRADPSCLQSAALRQGVEERLGRKVFVPRTNADVLLHGEVAPGAAGWTASLELATIDGRVLGVLTLESQTPGCDALTDVLPIVVALLVDLPREEIQLELPEPTYVPEKARRPRVVSPRSPTPARPERWRFGLGAGMQVAKDLVPTTQLGGFASAWVEPSPRWLAELSLGIMPPASSEGDPSVRVDTALVGAMTCVSVRRTPFLGPCLGAAVGRVRAQGEGLDYGSDDARVWVDARGTVRLDLQVVDGIVARIDAGLAVPVAHQDYVVVQADGSSLSLHRSADVIPLARLGAAWRIP